MGFFGKIIGALKKTRDNISAKLSALFSRGIGDDFYDELEEILISADISVATAEEIVEQIREEARREKLKDKEYVVDLLKDVIEDILNEAEVPKIEYPAVFMLVGVNGVGKTTTIGKLANYFVREKKSVTLAAADTFRAAAADQLTVWADRAKVRIVKHEEGSDPSAVVFDAVSSAKAKNTDVVIVDTAGRLHVKANLMAELQKMDRVVAREYPEAHFYKLLVLDARRHRAHQVRRHRQGRLRRVAVRRAAHPRPLRRHRREDGRPAALRRGRIYRGHRVSPFRA